MDNPIIIGDCTLYLGDCISVVKTLADQSVNCVITSPPYWGLRDYKVDGQFGLEPTPDLYVQHLVELFREIKRVLKDDGSVWLNLGDSYAGNCSRASNGGRAGFGTPREGVFDRGASGLKDKDLVGIPWRVAFALQADGWWLRSDIIWAKRNCMPESVKDRPTRSHEYIFLLTKSARYYYDNTAIAEKSEWASRDYRSKIKGGVKSGGKTATGLYATDKVAYREDGLRNKRSVWWVSTKPFKDAHFATFPEDLIEPCVLAGSRKGDVILDPFNGAGTTGVVALKHDRDYIGIELNPDYIEMSQKRIDESIQQEKLL
jgi:DNA modification methylase